MKLSIPISLAVTLTVLLVPVWRAVADEVVTYEGTKIVGRIAQLDGGQVVVNVEGEKKPIRVPLGNVSTIKLVPPPPIPDKHGTTLLIDNDGFHAPTEKSGKIKLRQGMHYFTLPYFQGTQGASLELKWEGPGIKKQVIPPNVLRKWKTNQNDVTYSEGFDEEGFRQPDTIGEVAPQIDYKLFEWTQNGIVREIGDLRELTLKKYGTTRQVNLNFPHSETNFGVMMYGFIKAPRDGEYTFYLNCDDGGQLYIGKPPAISQPSIRDPKDDEWLVKLDDEAQLNGPLVRWDDEGATFEFTVGKHFDVTIPPAQLRELWSREFAGKPGEIDRSGEVPETDTVYAKNADGKIQQVSGTVHGVSEGALKFEFNGSERTISLDKIAAIMLRQPDEKPDYPKQRVRILFDFVGPSQFVGYLTELSGGGAVIEMPWGTPVPVSRNLIYKLHVLNGRVQSLQDLNPTEVVQTPFFDRVLPWQAGKSLTGGRLRIGSKEYDKGLCLHSRTKLTYILDGEFDRFQCELGLQRPEGDAGNATVRITADGDELFVAEELIATDEPQSLDLEVTGKDQLTLEVDFGRNMHIGDHVVFGDARLLRPELAP